MPNGDKQFFADLDRIRDAAKRYAKQGRYVDGTYKGMTHEEVLADRDLYRRLVGE